MSHKTFKTGNYWVGDPCYVFEHERWLVLCRQVEKFYKDKKKGYGVIPFHGTFEGNRLWKANTAFGDGEYYDKDHTHRFPVDSGCLGVVPIAMVDAERLKEALKKNLGYVIHFNYNFIVDWQDDGVFTIGHLTIYT